jgi:hypothetical protein
MNVIARWEFVKIGHFLVIFLNIVRWCHGVVSTRRKGQWLIRWCTYSLVGHGPWTDVFCFSHKKFLWTLYQSLVMLVSLPVSIPYWSVPRYMLLDFAANLNSRCRWLFAGSEHFHKWWQTAMTTCNTDDLTMMFIILIADSCSTGQKIVFFTW